MENKTSTSEEESQDTVSGRRICRSTARSMRSHIATLFENIKSEFRELKTKDIPDLVAIEVTQAVKKKKADFKDVIEVDVRSPTLMSQLGSVMLEDEEVLRTFAQYAQRRV